MIVKIRDMGEKTKQNTIYYERGQSSVNPNPTYKNIFFTQSIFTNLIGNYMWNNPSKFPITVYGVEYIPHNVELTALITQITDTLYRAEYIPYIDAHSKIGKQNITNTILSKTSIYDNQSEKVIDLNRFGLNLYGKINRIGNKELTIDTVENCFDKLLNVGDIYDGFVVVSREYQIFREVVKVRYQLSKDYNNISERIAINRERRLYNIPIENLKRNVFIKDYILASTAELTIPASKKALLNNSGLNDFLKNIKKNKVLSRYLQQSLKQKPKIIPNMDYLSCLSVVILWPIHSILKQSS